MDDWLARISDPKDSLRFELRACRGIPHSVFMGRPVVTTYDLDPAGRVVRSVTVQWSADDRAKVFALALYEARLCHRGHDTAESMQKINSDAYTGLTIGECQICAAVDIEASRWDEYKRANALVFSFEGPDPEVQASNRAVIEASGESVSTAIVPAEPDDDS